MNPPIVESVKSWLKSAFLSVIAPDLPGEREAPRLILADEAGSRRLALCPSRRKGATMTYKLELGRKGNLAPLYKGTFTFYLEGWPEPLAARSFKARRMTCDGYENVFDRTADGSLRLRIKPVWPRGEKTPEQREDNAVSAYARFRERPIEERTIFFESMSKRYYNDNPRAIYEYLRDHTSGWDLVWGLTNEKTDIGKGGRAVRYRSLEYYYHLATAKYIVSNINQYQLVKRPGQIVIQTMHGVPLKHMGLSVAKSPTTIENMHRVFEHDWDLFVTPCDFMSNILRSDSFNYAGRFLETGYPRNDVLIRSADDAGLRDRVRDALGVPRGKKLILYAPTFRRKTGFDLELDLNLLRERLAGDYVVAIRAHYLVKQFVSPGIYDDFAIDGHRIEDANDLLVAADALVTDYSSIMFDYALLKRPLVLFAYDWDSYAGSRGVYCDIPSEFPGLLATTSEEVAAMIEDPSRALEELDRFSRTFNQYETGHAARDVVEAVWGHGAQSIRRG